MASRKSDGRPGGRIDWRRWLHDPKHWEQFYDELAIETYAAIGRRLWDGHWRDEAVELAVEDISAKMRAEGLPQGVIASYREEYFKHAKQLAEIAGEIVEAMPCPERTAGPSCGAEVAAVAQSPLALPFWLAKTYWGGMASCLRDAQAWLHENHGPDRRRPGEGAQQASLQASPRRRRRDVDVERL